MAERDDQHDLPTRLDRRRMVRLLALQLAIALSETTVDGVIADAKKIEAYINEGVYGSRGRSSNG